MTAYGSPRTIGIMQGASAPSSDEATDHARRLEELQLRMRRLERERIAAGPSLNRAGLVALDVELCRVEAARRMLEPST